MQVNRPLFGLSFLVDGPRRSSSTWNVPASAAGAVADSVQSIHRATGLHVVTTMSTKTQYTDMMRHASVAVAAVVRKKLQKIYKPIQISSADTDNKCTEACTQWHQRTNVRIRLRMVTFVASATVICSLGHGLHTYTTQPCIPQGSLNRVPASAGIKAGISPLTGGR